MTDATTYGVAMELQGQEALDYLNNREMKLGGYIQKFTMFYTKDEKQPPFPVLVFLATSKSPFWLGPADPQVIAEQVVTSSGPSGHNVEYVLRLAEWLHSTLPSVHDHHLFSIEAYVRNKVKERNLNLKNLMGEDKMQNIDIPLKRGPSTRERIQNIFNDYISRFVVS